MHLREQCQLVNRFLHRMVPPLREYNGYGAEGSVLLQKTIRYLAVFCRVQRACGIQEPAPRLHQPGSLTQNTVLQIRQTVKCRRRFISNFRLLPSLLSETVQLKEKTLLLRIFSFRCILLPCVMGYRFVFCTFSKSFIDFME